MQAKNIPDAELLRMLAAHRRTPELPTPWDALVVSGVPEKVVQAKYRRFLARGWIDYGVSLNTAWLTAEGEAALLPPNTSAESVPRD